MNAPKIATGRRLCLTLAAALVTLGVVLAPTVATAEPPVGWEKAPHVSGLQYLLVFFLIPLGLFLLIALLAALPGWIRPSAYEQGQPWAGDEEWFGGPKDGIEGKQAPKQLAGADEQGGAGARF